MRTRSKPAAVLALLLAPLLAPAAAPKGPALAPPPATPQRPATDRYHGEAVSDPYQWLEQSQAEDVKAWSAAQNARTRGYLDRLPGREAIRRRITQLLTHESPAYVGLEEKGGTLFALKIQPPRQQPLLVVLASADDVKGERVLLDPVALDPSGKTTIDWFVPTRDGKRVAVSLSSGGTESGDVHVYDVASGRPLAGEAVVSRVNGGTAGGSLAWTADGRGYFYTRYPRGEERPPADRDFFQQVWFHELGKPTAQDTYQLGRELPRIAMTRLESSEDGAWVSARVANGDGGEFALWVKGPDAPWAQVSRFEDKVVDARFGRDGALYLLSRQGAPRGKVLRLPLAPRAQLAAAREVVPEGEATLQEVVPTQHRLYLVEQLGGPTRLRVVGLGGEPLGEVPTLPVSTVGGVTRVGEGDDVLFANTSYVQPLAWYRYDAKAQRAERTALVQTAPADMSDVTVVRTECTSQDGTRVPLTVLAPRGLARNGNNPTLLTGYGGFNIPLQPSFSKLSRAWLEQGGVLAIANLRGGSEFGEAWHQAGALTKKQNVFDDFHACARRLVEQRYTSPKRLAIQGGSNGGLLMGAALTQHPEAYAAVVARVGIYDMLRVERTPNGQFNVTEYGSTQDPAQYRALRAYSPYHHVKDGTRYPPTLFTSGANDPRVDPFHSRKMVARLQAAQGGKGVTLLRESGETGHGMGTPLSARIEEEVDAYSFLFHQLGVRYRPVEARVPAPRSR